MVATNHHGSRAPEFHGFVAWSSTVLLFALYLLWALLPDEYIVWLGIRWYPNREWALLFPSWTVLLFLFTYFAYSMLAIARTPSFNNISAVSDRCSRFQKAKLSMNQHNLFMTATMPGAAPEIHDMPIGMINHILYGRPCACDCRKTESPDHVSLLNHHTRCSASADKNFCVQRPKF